MEDQTAELMLEAKHAFEHFASTQDMQVKHYHADNGIFTDSLF